MKQSIFNFDSGSGVFFTSDTHFGHESIINLCNRPFSSVKEIAPLRDILFGGTGTLLVYFHIEIDGKTYVVKANTQLTVPNTKEYIDSLKDISGVNEVWTE